MSHLSLEVRTLASHAEVMGSIPIGGAKKQPYVSSAAVFLWSYTSSTASGPPSPQGEGKVRSWSVAAKGKARKEEKDILSWLLLEEKLDVAERKRTTD